MISTYYSESAQGRHQNCAQGIGDGFLLRAGIPGESDVYVGSKGWVARESRMEI